MVNIHEYLGEFLVLVFQCYTTLYNTLVHYMSEANIKYCFTSLHLSDIFSYLQLFISSRPVLSKFDHFEFRF